MIKKLVKKTGILSKKNKAFAKAIAKESIAEGKKLGRLAIKEIRKEKNLLIVVGGAKVEPVFYELADFNISVTNQPHSEVASLAIILDKYFNEKEFSLDFKNAKRKIIEGTNKTLIVSSPEDIIVPKLVRSVNSLRRTPLFEGYTSSMKCLSEEEIRSNLVAIAELRDEAMLNPGDLERSELLRFVSDLYDIRLLSELGGINEDYFNYIRHNIYILLGMLYW